MNENQTLVLLCIQTKIQPRKQFTALVYVMYSSRIHRMKTIDWCDLPNNNNVLTFKDVKPHHKKLIIFTDVNFENIIFEESKANPCKELKIEINIIDFGDGISYNITNNFKIDKYPVEYFFFHYTYICELNTHDFKDFSFKTNEEITTDTFIQALEDEKKYVELSLKLTSRLFKINKNINFPFLEKYIINKDNFIQQKYLNLKYFKNQKLKL